MEIEKWAGVEMFEGFLMAFSALNGAGRRLDGSFSHFNYSFDWSRLPGQGKMEDRLYDWFSSFPAGVGDVSRGSIVLRQLAWKEAVDLVESRLLSFAPRGLEDSLVRDQLEELLLQQFPGAHPVGSKTPLAWAVGGHNLNPLGDAFWDMVVFADASHEPAYYLHLRAND